MNINDAIELLKTYNGTFGLTLRHGADEALIRKVETTYGITLPDDFKTFYRFTDGFNIDEDDLNMVPLEELIGYKKSDEQIWIAEYMIYCDSWALKINPEDCNDYSIYGYDVDHGGIALTHSLGEFIERVLKGGVYEIGGIYHWKDEINAKIYGNTKAEEIKPHLNAFVECLNLELISLQRVINWAEWIVSSEHEPDDFFIKISLSKDLNELLSIFNSMDLTEDIMQIRTIFGVVYLQYLRNKMTSDRAVAILKLFVGKEDFTLYETNEMQYLTAEMGRLESHPNSQLREQLNERIKTFFGNYSGLSLYNYKRWERLNVKIVEDFQKKVKGGSEG